jgi:hypothetical protein
LAGTWSLLRIVTDHFRPLPGLWTEWSLPDCRAINHNRKRPRLPADALAAEWDLRSEAPTEANGNGGGFEPMIQ